jgi:hypothetical protein
MKTIFVIFIFILLISCSHTKNSDVKTTKNIQIKENCDLIKNTRFCADTFLSMGDPDTALAAFLILNGSKFNYEDQYNEYIRWDLEKGKIEPIIKMIASDKCNQKLLFENLDKNSKIFVKMVRNEVLEDYKNNNGISGQSFDFLISRRDSIVIPLINQLLKNNNVSADEKEYAREMLKRLK